MVILAKIVIVCGIWQIVVAVAKTKNKHNLYEVQNFNFLLL